METVRISSNQLYLRRAQDHIELSLNIEIKDVLGYNRLKLCKDFLDDDEKIQSNELLFIFVNTNHV